MSAQNAELNPIFINKKSISLLTQAAISDAKHDFGDEFKRIFDGMFNGKRFKNIGTSLMPPEMEIKQEHQTLDLFLNNNNDLHEPTGNRWQDSLFPGRDAVSGSFEKKIGPFNLHPDLSPPGAAPIHKYELITEKFDEPTFNSQKFFEFLKNNLNTGEKIYVQQDAGCISYNDKFSGKDREEDNPPLTEPQYLFHYLNSREGQNDAAGKTGEDNPAVTKSVGKKVKVLIKEEEKNDKGEDRAVLYGNLPNESFYRNIPVTRNFNSIYNIEISPIIMETKEEDGAKKQKKTARVSMYFRDDKNVIIGSTNKGKRENAKTTLASILNTFFNKLLKGQKETAPYFQSLQQKRGGDWLQCLATFDKHRFGLAENDTIILFTHDLICLAYALANGLHVLFSFNAGARGKRIMLFRNNNNILAKGIISYLNEIESLTKNLSNLLSSIPNELQAYARSRKNLVDDLSRNIFRKIDSFNTAVDNLNNVPTINKDVRILIRDLLKVFFEYSYFCLLYTSPSPRDLSTSRMPSSA